MAWDTSLKLDKKEASVSSIRTRLALFYTLGAFVLLTMVALFLYWLAINILYKADYQFLSDEADTIQYILETKPVDHIALKQAVVDIPNQPEHSIYHYYTRVFDNDHIVVETPGMDKILPAKKHLHKNLNYLNPKRFSWYSHHNNHYLLLQAPIKLHAKKHGLVQVALDISYQHQVVSDRKKLFFVLLMGTLFSLLIGFLIAHRGMRSFYLLTEAVHRITVSSLHERIDPKSWPKELSGISIAFNQMLSRIENSFVRLKQFSDDLSHELRTPITNLMGQTEMALSYTNSVDEYREVMASNLEELQRISSLIENILFLARAENPQLNLQKTTVALHDEITFMIDYYDAMIAEKNLQVSQTGQAKLTANVVMIRRMIGNILSNAIKHTKAGGYIRFIIEETVNEIHLTALDNGSGIAAHHLPKIFDRFYRIDSARSQQSGGTGLGLAIVQSIVHMHQGQISIHSEIDKGTTLKIRLPK